MGLGPRASEDDKETELPPHQLVKSHMTRNADRRTEDRRRSIFERQAVGWAIVIALGLLALVVAAIAFAALPLLVAAFPLTIAAVLIALAIGYIRHHKRRRG